MTFKRESFRMEKPVAANYVTPSGVTCVQVLVPDDVEHVALLQGLAAQMTNPDNWQGTEAEIAQLSYLWEVAYIATTWEDCIVPEIAVHRADIWSRFAAVSGGTLSRTLMSFMTFGYTMQTDTTASRMMTDTVYLSAGTWEYRGLYAKSTDAGINFVTLTPVGAGFINLADNLDQYGLSNAEFIATTTIELDEPGLFTLQTKNTGSKNASSAGYRVNWTSHHFWRTGD